jgi:hypothetical protein
MNRTDIRLLEETRGYPCLTITLPTHRTSPDNRQDPIRVKNLVTQAADRLINELGKREAGPLLDRLEALITEIDYRYALDGLAIFVSNDVARKFYLPFTLPERVVVDESFATRDLVFAMNRTPRYWVLSLSEKPTRLYEGTRETLEEINEGTPFPLTHGGPGGGAGLPNDPAVNSSQFRDEHHRIFFRSVDEAFAPLMTADPLPLAVVGVDRYLSFFNEVSSHANQIVATVRGSHDKTPPHELGALVWPEVKAALAAQRAGVLDELNAAVGGQRSASTIGEVWRFAHEGRGQTLIVEEDFHYPARVDATGMQLTPAEDVEAPDVIDDAVDEVIFKVLSMGGRVVFADNGALEKHNRIALILRY